MTDKCGKAWLTYQQSFFETEKKQPGVALNDHMMPLTDLLVYF